MISNAVTCRQLLEVRICFWQPSWVCLASSITWQVQLLAASMPRLAPGADWSTMSKACVVAACLSVTVLGAILSFALCIIRRTADGCTTVQQASYA